MRDETNPTGVESERRFRQETKQTIDKSSFSADDKPCRWSSIKKKKTIINWTIEIRHAQLTR